MKLKSYFKNYLFNKLTTYTVVKKKIKLQYYHYLYPKVLTLSATVAIGSYFKLLVFDIRTCKLIMRDGVEFRNYCNLLLMGDGLLTIEKGVFFNNFCSISCLGKIDIGEFTMFGEGVKIYDHNHLYSFNRIRILEVERQKFDIGFVKIGRNCWIGSNVTVLNNVEIGDNVIIGANCLIYKSIPSNTIIKHAEELIVSDK